MCLIVKVLGALYYIINGILSGLVHFFSRRFVNLCSHLTGLNYLVFMFAFKSYLTVKNGWFTILNTLYSEQVN